MQISCWIFGYSLFKASTAIITQCSQYDFEVDLLGPFLSSEISYTFDD